MNRTRSEKSLWFALPPQLWNFLSWPWDDTSINVICIFSQPQLNAEETETHATFSHCLSHLYPKQYIISKEDSNFIWCLLPKCVRIFTRTDTVLNIYMVPMLLFSILKLRKCKNSQILFIIVVPQISF